MRSVDPDARISQNFTWRDALYLPTWARVGTEKDGLSDEILDRLLHLFWLADLVQEFFQKKIIIHVAWRPIQYNQLIHGARDSAHIALHGTDAALDFHVQGLPVTVAQKRILDIGMLEHWGMRMENNGETATWIHLDTRTPLPGHPRYFNP